MVHLGTKVDLKNACKSLKHIILCLYKGKLSHETFLIIQKYNFYVLLNYLKIFVSVSCMMYWPFFYQPGIHPLNLQNLSGHALIPAYNIIDVFISARYSSIPDYNIITVKKWITLEPCQMKTIFMCSLYFNFLQKKVYI